MNNQTYIAILLTSFNRREKTLNCLKSIYEQQLNKKIDLSIFLVDDNSNDGTSSAIFQAYPNVKVIKGSGNLFWAGGMRLAFLCATDNYPQRFDFYLLLNDDTVLFNYAISELLKEYFALPNDCILVGSTKGEQGLIGKFTYGGRKLKNNYNTSSNIVLPNGNCPQQCDLGNANIMLVPSSVISRIGFFSAEFTHGIADFDYTLTAKECNIPTFIASNYLGFCNMDFKNEWLSLENSNLNDRLKFLRSVKGLASKEYLLYIRKHFPLYVLEAWALLWGKTLFPFVWDIFKKSKQ